MVVKNSIGHFIMVEEDTLLSTNKIIPRVMVDGLQKEVEVVSLQVLLSNILTIGRCLLGV